MNKYSASFVLLIGLIFSAKSAMGEHATDKGGADSPEAEASTNLDCGDRIGSASFYYQGRLLFAGITYDLGLRFGPKEDIVTLDFNLGINDVVTLNSSKYGLRVTTGRKTYYCAEFPRGCVDLAKKAKKALETAKARVKNPTDFQNLALACASKKVELFTSMADAAYKKYMENQPTDSGPSLYFRPTSYFDGEGPRLGF